MVNLADKDINWFSNSIAEVAKSILKWISKKQLQLTNKLTKHINQLIEAINKFKATIEAETYGMDPSIPLVTPELVLPIKVELHGWVMEIGIIEYDDVVHGFEMLRIEFSNLTLAKVYAI